MKLLAAVAVTATILAGQTGHAPLHSVTAVRHWSLPDTTRIAIEVSGDFQYRTERLHNPERVYYDILNSRPRFEGKRLYKESLADKLVTGVRVAETLPGVTRVVLDLTGAVEATTSQLTNPNRLMIELRMGAAPTIPTGTATAPPPPPPAEAAHAAQEPVTKAVPKPQLKAEAPAPVTEPPARPASKPSQKADAPPPAAEPATKPVSRAPLKAEASAPAVMETVAKPVSKLPSKTEPAAPPLAGPVEEPAPKTDTAKPESKTELAAAENSKAARHTSSGNTSLVRALGLKIGRVVIDAGHGGHDQGTSGAKGLLEKDVVLDVALRVGKLIEDRLGAEVIYTRSDDTFVPLEGRTALANEKKADLFLSIHANSSSLPRITGVETYYLNLPDSRDKDAADVAARENASSQKSVFELQDLVKKITLNDKVEESREFAGRVQASLSAFSVRNIPNSRNRGVKKAPFVVLIGAHMPSILAEIGFLTNAREEALLRKPDYRQKLAEALFRGVQRYAEGLSHFQVAKAGEEE
jgi:N-acetylmuramoyl-L-alanine amidase